MIVSLSFLVCVDPGTLKGEKTLPGKRLFVLCIYFVNSGSGAGYWWWDEKEKKMRRKKCDLKDIRDLKRCLAFKESVKGP